MRVSLIGRIGAVLLIALVPATASAGIIVSIDSVALTTGGSSGFVNVNVAWQDPDPGGSGSVTSVDVDNFFANLVISPVGAPTSVVSFRSIFDPLAGVSHNGDLQQTNPDYLLFGNSLNAALSQHDGTVGGANDTVFNGSDARANTGPGDLVTLTPVPRLLYQLELIATGTATGIEQFTLQIDPSPASQFFDNGGVEIPFSSVSGTITVTGAAAVPEPGTGILFVMGSGLLIWRRRRSFQAVMPDCSSSGKETTPAV